MTDQTVDNQDEQELPELPTSTRAGVFIGSMATVGIVEAAGHLGMPGLVGGTFLAVLLTAKSPHLVALRRKYLPTMPEKLRSLQQRFTNRAYDEEVEAEQEFDDEFNENTSTQLVQTATQGAEQNFEALLKTLPKSCTLSQVIMNDWHPSREHIFMGFQADGNPIFASAAKLCHVALAGATDGGKSSIMRLLMAQLCAVGCKVLLLNPHYTRYDRESDEDWTPFEPFLMRDPMECKDFKVIAECLQYAATTLLPKRIERRARGQRVGDPYFIVLDELPAIIDEIPDAPKYLGKLLRQGRKFGIFLMSASQDFLVKTIDPKGTGSGVRECYRTAFYVGGDTTTGKVLLDIQSVKDIPEEILGKGVVMLRAGQEVKRASLVRVPFLDNDGLYYLLGPSTYDPEEDLDDEDDEDAFFQRGAKPKPLLVPRQDAAPEQTQQPEKVRVMPVAASRRPQPTLNDAIIVYNELSDQQIKVSRYNLRDALVEKGFECGESKARALLGEIIALQEAQ